MLRSPFSTNGNAGTNLPEKFHKDVSKTVQSISFKISIQRRNHETSSLGQLPSSLGGPFLLVIMPIVSTKTHNNGAQQAKIKQT